MHRSCQIGALAKGIKVVIVSGSTLTASIIIIVQQEYCIEPIEHATAYSYGPDIDIRIKLIFLIIPNEIFQEFLR